jgi:hypothetical protein
MKIADSIPGYSHGSAEVQLQIALWARPYTDSKQAPNEW